MNYSYIYYTSAILVLLSAPAFSKGTSYRASIELRTLIVVLIFVVYALGMSRSEGEDLQNYRFAFEVDPLFIPDPGYQLINIAFNWIGLPFSVLLLSIALVNFYAIVRLTKHFNISLGLLLIFWFLHTAVVRDFSQLRVSLAISFAVIGLTSNRFWFKWLLYCFGASIHITSIVFAMAYEACKRAASFRSAKLQWLFIFIMAAASVALGLALRKLSFLSERIDIYLLWDAEGYGMPVNSFGTIALHLLILILSIQARGRWIKDSSLRTLVFLEILGISTFIAFSNYAIFAFRLSNVIFSLYPVLLILIAGARGREDEQGRIGAINAIILLAIGVILLMRQGSYDIIDVIKL